ncbi:DUF4153 domain-containing protein [Hymenobacter psychrotolerans]|uniref:DUF4153 domain-containing protein n=1 Tax=Hymenobacter psychrotolerans DSM 18569 TaxID=1121959 RepID=A0A1M6V538_9BACT|nr:DUF4153 domain-containing protein [Hymenobacter psychrotolerans]SHK76599.1 protein of unknown function [Hymenobacter psychrotolerans DSM 18569]
MRLPSLQHLTAQAARAVQRFPLPLLCSLLLGAVAIYYQRLDYKQRDALDWLFPLVSAAALGLTLTLSVALAGERYRWSALARVLVNAGAVGLLGLWYVLCPTEPTSEWGLRLLLLLLGLHLLVAVVPYLPELRREADTPGFWRYNETLFLRILTGGLYSGVLFAGCALALVAVENLFDVKLDRHIYEHLFTVLATGFNTWFFLAGVPHDWKALEQDTTYPKGLKLFTQFVLLPLVVLYLVILYAYLARIVVLWTLPKGWVSTLILAFSVAGIFALLLIHPIRNAAENTWIRTFARWFYRALFPLLGLLFVAIGTRVGAYGITEERYFVLILALWLAGMAAYFLLRKGRGIIWIPASLAAVVFLSAAGPWGAFATAERSQLSQLRELAAEYKLLKDGKLDGAGKRVPKLPKEAARRITSIFEFFVARDKLAQLQPFFATRFSLPDSLRSQAEWKQRSWLNERPFAASGLPRWVDYAVEVAPERWVSFSAEQPDAQPLGQGRYWLRRLDASQHENNDTLVTLRLPEGTYRLRTTGNHHRLLLERQVNREWQRVLAMQPGAVADSLVQQRKANALESTELIPEQLTLRVHTPKASLSLYLRSLQRQAEDDKVTYSFYGDALLELKE